MKYRPLINTNQTNKGFTIVELLMATVVFSLVLVAAVAGFIQVGRLFYKGVTAADAKTTAQQIMDDIATGIRAAATVTPPTSVAGYNYFCVDGARYTFNMYKEVDLSATQNLAPSGGGNFGLVKDVLPGTNACATPCLNNAQSPCGTGSAQFADPAIELLGNKMRLSALNIQSSGSGAGFYTISLKITSGDDSTLTYSIPGNQSTAICTGSSANQQFCSVMDLQTSVYKGSNP